MVKQFILNTILNFVRTYKIYLVIAISSIIAIFTFYGAYNIFHKETIKEQPKTPIQTQIQRVNSSTSTKTTFGYVPKATINGVKEETDVEAVVEQPKVTVKVNGKDHKFDLKQTETQKFQDGKVVMEQKSEVVFDVKVPKKHELNVYAQEEFRAGKFHTQVGVDKQNGKFHYGAKYDFNDKEPSYYVRYDLVKMTTN